MIHVQDNKYTVLLAPTTAATTTRAATFDWSGADYATIIVTSSAAAATSCAVSILDADTAPTAATNFGTITADATADSTSSHQHVYHIDLKTRKHYGKVILTPNTTTTETVITGVNLILSRMEQSPSNTTAMVGSTNDAVTIVG